MVQKHRQHVPAPAADESRLKCRAEARRVPMADDECGGSAVIEGAVVA